MNVTKLLTLFALLTLPSLAICAQAPDTAIDYGNKATVTGHHGDALKV